MALRGSLLLLLSAALACADAQRAAVRSTGAAAARARVVDSTLAAVLGAAPAGVVPPVPECSLDAGSGPLVPGARFSVNITSGGKARTFLVRLPDTPAPSMPVLLAVHGALQSATIFLDVAGAVQSDAIYGAPPDVKIDTKAAKAGFVTIAPNSLCDTPLQINTCRWAETATTLDPGWAADQQFSQQDEMLFFVDAIACVKSVLNVDLSGDVYAIGFSQGAKLVTRFGCAAAAISSELRLRGVVAGEGFFADEAAYPTCGAVAGGITPPPMLLFQAQQDAVVPYCTPGAAYIQSSEYFHRWAAGYSGCQQTVPFGQQILVDSPVLMQAMCPPGVSVLSLDANVTGAVSLPAVATHLQRVYTNGVGCTAPLALFWTSENAATGHKWPAAMQELGGMDATDVSLAFFAQLQTATPGLVLSSFAFQPFLTQMSACKTLVPDGAPPLLGLSAGPCSDLQGVVDNAWQS